MIGSNEIDHCLGSEFNSILLLRKKIEIKLKISEFRRAKSANGSPTRYREAIDILGLRLTFLINPWGYLSRKAMRVFGPKKRTHSPYIFVPITDLYLKIFDEDFCTFITSLDNFLMIVAEFD